MKKVHKRQTHMQTTNTRNQHGTQKRQTTEIARKQASMHMNCTIDREGGGHDAVVFSFFKVDKITWDSLLEMLLLKVLWYRFWRATTTSHTKKPL